MANLLGQNIGTNYKGILNLNTLNGNVSGTLQAVTDGDGNASPLLLSTTSITNLGAGAVATGNGGNGAQGAIWITYTVFLAAWARNRNSLVQAGMTL